MDPVTIGLAIDMIAGLGAGWLSGKGNRAMKAQMEKFMAFAQQGIGVLKPFVGRPSPLLASQHRLGMQDINQTEQSALARSRGYGARIGNPSRGFGSDLRIRTAATGERNRASMGYAGAETNLQDRRRSELAQLMAGLSGTMFQGFKGVGQAQGDTYEDIAAAFGNLLGGVKTAYGTPKKKVPQAGKDFDQSLFLSSMFGGG